MCTKQSLFRGVSSNDEGMKKTKINRGKRQKPGVFDIQ